SIVGSSGNEQGLLSVAFHPNYPENGRLFVDYTNQQGDTEIAQYTVSSDPNQADPNS
ncbi:MAG: PQQ-dependent sugar dehydrogenase, partial [Anaerolineae bacterium]|nr:PQQ-dependent sugar dehydrogenase [Anaerolineae bacterium]